MCPLSLLVLSSLSLPAHALASSSPPPSAGGISFCRCTCFGKNSTIIPLYRPAVPSNPCLSCTRQFCLDQKLAACVGAQTPDEDPDTATGEGGDVEAKCFRASSSLRSLSSSSSSSRSRTLPSLTPLPRPLAATERDSPKSHFIVVLFLVITATLVVVAALKHFGIDLPALFVQAGVKGIVSVRPARRLLSLTMSSSAETDIHASCATQELIQGAKALLHRRRGGPSYASVSS